ncbi:hypothetical protein G6F16_013968 [Rhizopus arrhizus]|nr:hypothetical protein G6F16_013968 [Rhizopus arrhizus]KAG1081390.1 hypothetical protein G6F40_015509 [Rhizopus arrhizus]KAG1141756.1 hypothetical protein G6F36_015654 [Rhizopus arrhizus]
MLDLGIIRPSKSGAYSSPCFFVKKKDGSRRMVLDYRKLNQMTVSNAYPLPLISELLDSLGGAKFFTTMDMAFGYWQVPMAEDSIEKTGFVTKKGIYEFLVMPFGLTSAPSTFQAMMNSILGEYIVQRGWFKAEEEEMFLGPVLGVLFGSRSYIGWS